MGKVYSYPSKGVDVNIQDPNSPSTEAYFSIRSGILGLSVPTVIGEYTLTVMNTTGVLTGNIVSIQNGVRGFQALVADVTNNVITLNIPFDYSFPVNNTIVAYGVNNLNINGSSTPKIAIFKPTKGVSWDIYTISMSITDEVVMDDAKFGGITALSKGILIRKINQLNRSLLNIKSNADFAERGTLIYSDKAPSGVYGLNFVKNFIKENGIAIRLNGDNNEQLEIIIQDDLSALSSFKCMARGHVVVN